jgi:hypothetical protein
MSKKVFIIFLLLITYTLILGHNLVPHYHEDVAVTNTHSSAADHHHDHDHDHPPGGEEDSDESNSGPHSFLNHHQHSFADNKIHHPDSAPAFKLAKRQTYPVLVCFLSLHFRQLRLPDKIPDAPAYQFPPNYYSCQSHALRGPPVA